jgi:hypothetical protein
MQIDNQTRNNEAVQNGNKKKEDGEEEEKEERRSKSKSKKPIRRLYNGREDGGWFSPGCSNNTRSPRPVGGTRLREGIPPHVGMRIQMQANDQAVAIAPLRCHSYRAFIVVDKRNIKMGVISRRKTWNIVQVVLPGSVTFGSVSVGPWRLVLHTRHRLGGARDAVTDGAQRRKLLWAVVRSIVIGGICRGLWCWPRPC